MQEIKIMRILREANGYSQEYVASQLEIEQNTYSKLESGQIKLTVDRMKKLADLYNVKPEYFFSDDMTVIHYNHGKGSNSNSGSIQSYYNRIDGFQKEFYEKLIQAKDEQIKQLSGEIQDLRKEQENIIRILEKISDKI